MDDKSIKIGTNTGSSVVSGNVEGDVSSEIKNSFNKNTQKEKQNLAEAAREIQELLKELEKTYPTETTTEKMVLATETIKCIENNPNLRKRILSALKTGGVKAFEKLLNHPAASFVVGALEDWEKNK